MSYFIFKLIKCVDVRIRTSDYVLIDESRQKKVYIFKKKIKEKRGNIIFQA